MKSSTGTSLLIGFDITRTQALLRTVPEQQSDLEALLARFPNGNLTGRLSALIPVDDFLASLEALATWPRPESVVWEEPFQSVAKGMLKDAIRTEQILAGESDEDVRADDIVALLGDEWHGNLTDFQRRDIARLLTLGHGANFSVPGAGKTRVALAMFSILRQQGSVRRLLVVSPKSAYEAWQHESRDCFREPPEVHVVQRRVPHAADVLLVNYERLDRLRNGLAEWLSEGPAMMILDEAHRMKLGSAGVYGAACMALGPLTAVRMILTGTPAPNGPKDLESLLSFVWPGRGRKAVSQAIAGGDLAYASKKLKPLYARTTKQELGLPPIDVRIRNIELPALHREIYDALIGNLTVRAERSRSDFDAIGRTVLRLLMAATSPALLTMGATRYEPLEFQVPPLEVPESEALYDLLRELPRYEVPPKYQETLAIVAANAAVGKKTLVWASFVRSIMTLESLFADFRPAVVHGGTLNRQEQIESFRKDSGCAVLISNPATLGEGISLHQVCHDAVYVDRDFQAGRFLQSLDRIHRLGLSADVKTRVTVLAAKGTVDEIVALRLNEKLRFMGKILDDPAVQQLGDPEEDPPLAAGIDAGDVNALLRHVTDRKLS